MIYAACISRPDKPRPLLLWFTSVDAANRTIISSLHMIVRDFHLDCPVYSPSVGYRKAVERVRQAMGDDRMTADIGCFDAVKPPVGEVHEKPIRVLRWWRPHFKDIEFWVHGLRLSAVETKSRLQFVQAKTAMLGHVFACRQCGWTGNELTALHDDKHKCARCGTVRGLQWFIPHKDQKLEEHYAKPVKSAPMAKVRTTRSRK